MKTTTIRKTLAVVLSVLMLLSALPMSTMAATNADWQVEGDYVIFSGQSLYDGTGTSNMDSKELVYGAGQTYVKYNPTVGAKPQVTVQQELTGVNLAEYDYYVFKYLQSGMSTILDTTFCSSPAKTTDYDGAAYPYTWYEQWSNIGHPAASNGTWMTKTMTREEFVGCAAGFAPVSTLEKQLVKFKPWQANTAAEGSYFALEYFACFKTEAEAAAFIEMQSTGMIPVTSLAVQANGADVTDTEILLGETLPIDIISEPAYAAGAVTTSFSENILTLSNGVYTATSAGTTTLTVTANSGIEGAEEIVKTVDITVKAPGSVVIPATDIDVTLKGLTATTSVVNNDELEKKLLRTEITASTTGGDNAIIMYNISSANVLAKEYPYMQVGYRAKTTGAAYFDLNMNFDKYHPGGTGDAETTRLWGPKPESAQETYSTFNIVNTEYSDGEDGWTNTSAPFEEWVKLGYDWNWLDDTAIYTSLWLKPWPTTSISSAVGDYVEIEYVAFFTDEETMNSFEYKAELESLEVAEALSLRVGNTAGIAVTTAPESAYVKLNYEVEDENIAAVSDDGMVTGVAAGTTAVTVSTADGIYSSICEVTVLPVLEDTSVVIAAAELVDLAGLSGLTGTVSLVENDELQKRLIRAEITTGGNKGDGTSVEYNVSSFNVYAKSYPYIEIGYRAKTANNTYVDFNTGITNYHVSGGSTLKSVRLWGPKPATAQETFSKMHIDYTSYNGGQDVGSYNWSYVDESSVYSYLRLKPWFAGASVAGDYFEVEYIAFFADTESRDAFVYDTMLKGMTVNETMTMEKGSFARLPVNLEPLSAYTKLTYTSDNESVVQINADGMMTAIGTGTANVTVTTSDGAFTDTCVVTVTSPEKDYSQYIIDRDNLDNLVYRLENDKELTVVYLGGSITAGHGASNANYTSWRGLTGTWLKNLFPDADINLVNVAMGGSGSMLGAFRTDVDVLAYDPDLVFVEFAVNDSYSGHYTDGTVQLYYESILRQIREKSPETEIISIYTTDQSHLHDTSMHEVAALQDEVAAHYGVSSIDVGLALANHIVAEGAEWKEYVFDSVHPADAGYEIYANAIEQYLFSELFEAGYAPTGLTSHSVPDTYIDDRNEDFAHEYVVVSEDIFDSITNWTYGSGKVYPNLDTAGYIYPSGTDNSFTYTFKGTGIAFYMEFNISKDAGLYNYLVEYSIDGGEPTLLRITDTNHPFNKMYKTGTLENKEHTITFSYLGVDADGDMVVDENETGVRSGLKLTRLLVSKVAGDEEVTVLYGDVNSDGNVDGTDSVVLSRNLAGWAGYETINLANADVDGVDGVLAGDNVVLSRKLAGWTGYETLPLAPAATPAE